MEEYKKNFKKSVFSNVVTMLMTKCVPYYFSKFVMPAVIHFYEEINLLNEDEKFLWVLNVLEISRNKVIEDK